MSNFNFNNVKIGNATINLTNGEKLNAKLSVKINGELVVNDKQISAKIVDGVLLITY